VSEALRDAADVAAIPFPNWLIPQHLEPYGGRLWFRCQLPTITEQPWRPSSDALHQHQGSACGSLPNCREFLVLRRLVPGPGMGGAVELHDDVAVRRRLALERLNGTAAHQVTTAELLENRRHPASILLIERGVGHFDRTDDVSVHGHQPSTSAVRLRAPPVSIASLYSWAVTTRVGTRAEAIDLVATTLLTRASRLARVLMRSGPRELSRTEAGLLLTLLDGARRITELAETEALAQPTVTQLVDKLQQRGLVERTRSAEDGRVVLVSVSARGREQLESARAQSRALMRETVQELSDRELAELVSASETLGRLIETLQQRAGAPA
jgi:DNA-binding MarR family transcriptional regulator